MKNYLFSLGKNAKKASIENVSSVKKNQVLKDYIFLIKDNHSKIILENKKDLKQAEEKIATLKQTKFLAEIALNKNASNLKEIFVEEKW